tara:strand:- start:196 stop:873 length:678 start_codon:yes stop_codon:yes gene_type:complete
MALKFGDTKGSAQKDKLPNYRITDGNNSVRLVGDILARYVYWIKGIDGKSIPFECLAFDREAERFTNEEKDWVREFYPAEKCQWAYCIQAIDENGELMIFNLKKKLFDQIQVAAEDAENFGDPTDPDNGWTIHFTRKKNGPKVFNVEYTLEQMKSAKSKGPLSDAERAIYDAMKPIDEVLPRPTADAQKALLERIANGGQEEPEPEDDIDADIDSEFDSSNADMD